MEFIRSQSSRSKRWHILRPHTGHTRCAQSIPQMRLVVRGGCGVEVRTELDDYSEETVCRVCLQPFGVERKQIEDGEKEYPPRRVFFIPPSSDASGVPLSSVSRFALEEMWDIGEEMLDAEGAKFYQQE